MYSIMMYTSCEMIITIRLANVHHLIQIQNTNADFFLGQLTSIEQFLYEHKNVDIYVYEFKIGKLSFYTHQWKKIKHHFI